MVAFTRGHENYLHRFYLGCYLTVLESYNVFNHTQWGTINQNMSAPTAGMPFSGANAGALARSQLHVIPVCCNSGVSSTFDHVWSPKGRAQANMNPAIFFAKPDLNLD